MDQLTAKSMAHHVRSRMTWGRRGFTMPAPATVKRSVLDRYGDPYGTWVETGTYLGETTRHLARRARRVYTIEPSPQLAARAKQSLSGCSNVDVLHGLSEDLFTDLVAGLDGSVSFWLDGHTSGGVTFHGPQVTPIRGELAAIAANVSRFTRLAVLVDDFRGFGDIDGDYPSRDFLVEWSRRLGLTWTVEHDIFIAMSPI